MKRYAVFVKDYRFGKDFVPLQVANRLNKEWKAKGTKGNSTQYVKKNRSAKKSG